MYFLLLKNFIVSRVVVVGLVIVLLAGLIGTYNGMRHLQRLESNIEKTAHFQEEHIQRNVAFFNKDMGLLLYYLRFAYVNEANPLNGLFIGQRDVNNSIQFINIRNLEAQKYDADLYNPVNLLTGNLDFGFVLLYLFPLLIIAVTYNLLSEEKEGGTWALLSVQSRRPIKVLLQKLSIRAWVIYTLLALLFAVAIPVLSIPLDASFGATIGLSVLYLLFWFAVCFWVVSWKRPSAVNAVSLLTIWVLLTFILPAVINNYITAKYPVPEALATTVEQREGYHAKWDMDKKPTMESFYAHYPQFRKYPLPDAQFSWLWYYAMQQGGDDDAKVQVAELKSKLRMRSAASDNIARFIPTIHTQLRLNTLSQSDLDNHLRFIDSTEQFHERLRLHFYPKIFEGQEAKSEDWSRFKPEFYTEPGGQDHVSLFLPLLVFTCVLIVLCIINFRRGPVL
jgi:ABC-2 type transport system permease protein